jgi:tetratricopeptide (TPR) repeat protein
MKSSASLPWFLLATLLSPVAAHAEAAAAGHGESHAPPPAEKPAAQASSEQIENEERASLLRIGAAKLAAGDGPSALIAYRQIATTALNDEEEVVALLGLARAHRLTGDGVKAAATYEHLLKNHPDCAELPTALLELGRTLRDLGSPKLAMARFYSVINSTLKLPEAESERYRRIVRTAQFEIAETHLAMGNYPEAVRFFNRLDLLDLAPADRARARFKAAQSRIYAGDKTGAVTALTVFIGQDPNDTNGPEARFLLAQLLGELGRRDESLRVTLDLLNNERARGDKSGTWQTWQRRTGNQLANQFYQQGEFASALLVYRSLEALDPTPAWRVPVLYQLGLCLERLDQSLAATEAYGKIQKLAGETPPANLADIVRMAAWRSTQIAWTLSTRNQIRDLGPVPPPITPPLSQ